MPSLLRELLRQRLRGALTVSGAALGIFTLVVLGALGEHFRDTLEEAKGYTRGVVRLFTKTNAEGVNPGITPEVLARLERLPEVAVLSPTLVLFFDGFDLETDPLAIASPRPLVEGLDAAHARQLRGGLELLEGRWLEAGDERAALVADWIARRRGLTVGGEVVIRHLPYRVVGIYDAPDMAVIPAGIVPYPTLNEAMIRPQVERARRFVADFLAANPALATFAPPGFEDRFGARFVEQQESLFRVYELVPRDASPAGTRALVARLQAEVPDLAVIDPERVEQDLEKAFGMFLVITLIVTVISTVVGGLLIVNTMAMAVIERRRDIAIKAALGATPLQIAAEFVGEAALLGLAGAALGVALATGAVLVAEPHLLDRLDAGTRLFLITPRLVLLAVGYGVAMGAVAGGLPALRAARLDPARVLREL